MSSSQSSSSSTSSSRRTVLAASGGGLFGLFNNGNFGNKKKVNASQGRPDLPSVNGIPRHYLGKSDIVVSALGLGTQRWVSSDFNAPTKEECFTFLDTAILKHGVNLVDTAEQYPIPSDGRDVQEGDVERCIGDWMKDRKVSRDRMVIATKITGGRNVTPKNIQADCEGSLKRLQTDYIDVYLLHWPQRYSPQVCKCVTCVCVYYYRTSFGTCVVYRLPLSMTQSLLYTHN